MPHSKFMFTGFKNLQLNWLPCSVIILHWMSLLMEAVRWFSLNRLMLQRTKGIGSIEICRVMMV